MGNTRREVYTKRLSQLHQELAINESQLLGSLSNLDRSRLKNRSEEILKEIEEVEEKLSRLEANDANPNLRHSNLSNLEKSFQKIDFTKAKAIINSIEAKFGDDSGAILLFLQMSTKQKGDYCLQEVLEVIDPKYESKIKGEILGDVRPYLIKLDSSISELNEIEFSKRLAEHLKLESESELKNLIKKLCLSLRGGSVIFIRVENWDSLTNRDKFLDWFLEEFWRPLINELASIFNNYRGIRFIVALTAKSKVFKKTSCLPYFCTKQTFEQCKFIELPLPNWTVKDLERWLSKFRGLSVPESEQLAKEIHAEGAGSPDTICSILEKKYLEKEI
ncbi:MAG: hypothetical protein F6K58_28845 [Symploca sp. SIO2E9]|nr:hypothetical protein [Symploca sp. SIO2E9]